MKRVLFGLLASVALVVPSLAQEKQREDYVLPRDYDDVFYTYEAMQCMRHEHCTVGVNQVKAKDFDYNPEIKTILTNLDKMGVTVHEAIPQYFVDEYRALYYSDVNRIYLNKRYTDDPGMFIRALRHEGWHAAQDCMAGTIENNMIAIILPEESVPAMYQEIVKHTYQSMPHAIPWEKEAYWAGKTEGMTAKALESCARGTMWTDYEPTPLTRKYLVEKGFLSK